MYTRKLGILLGLSPSDGAGREPAPPRAVAEAPGLGAAVREDLFTRLSKLKKISTTVFHTGEDFGEKSEANAPQAIPKWFSIVRQDARAPGERFADALRRMLSDGNAACAIGSQCPDLPLVYLKRAYLKLKHRDVVLGPAFGGGVYLIGLKKVVPGLLDDLPPRRRAWFGELLRRVESAGLACAVLPPWYEVDPAESLEWFETMLLARRIEKRDRLRASERALEEARKRAP